jgi:hypothetical protein
MKKICQYEKCGAEFITTNEKRLYCCRAHKGCAANARDFKARDGMPRNPTGRPKRTYKMDEEKWPKSFLTRQNAASIFLRGFGLSRSDVSQMAVESLYQ